MPYVHSWLVLFIAAFLIAFALIYISQYMKGVFFSQAIVYSLAWGGFTAFVYATAAVLRRRHCNLKQQPGPRDNQES